MPAIQVARTDTFETQRVKINQIGAQIFDVTQGGSDLATGNLKLGDGTRTAPSLAFTSDNTLGLYRPENSVIGYVASGKKIADFGVTQTTFYKDVAVRKNVLTNAGISFIDYGSNYDSGSYTDILLVGGTGDNATLNIAVTEFTGSVTNTGSNYVPGTYSDIALVGGNGSGALANFVVSGIEGDITDAGSAYIPGQYALLDLTGGSGTGAVGSVEITGDTVINGSITNTGNGYTQGTYQFIPLINTPTTTHTITAVSNPGTPPPDNVYNVDGTIQQTLTFIKGNTYRFDVSDASMANHPLAFRLQNGDPLSNDYVVITKGSSGVAGSFVDLVIKPTASNETLEYYCSSHSGMGSTITVTTGSVGQYGTFAAASVEVDANGVVSTYTITNVGIDYKASDVIQVFPGDIGGTGYGFEFTISGISYTGVVDSITIVESGLNYENGDILSIDTADVGGVGSGFQFTITSFPGKILEIDFANKGSGYQANDVLTLPPPTTKTSVTIRGEKTGVISTLSTATPVITVADTSGILPGMTVQNGPNDVGNPGTGVTVLSVDSPTQLTLSANPIFDGAVELTFRSVGNLRILEIADTTGITVGSSVTISSGAGTLDPLTIVTNVNSTDGEVTISVDPVEAGVATLSFTPPYGVPTSNFDYTINSLGVITSATISNGGNGYSVGDLLSVNPTDLTSSIDYTVTNKDLKRITLTTSVSSGTISVGDFIREVDGDVQSFLTNAPTVTPTTVLGLSTTLSTASAIVTVTSTTGILPNMVVTTSQGDVGVLASPCTVISVDSPTQLTLSANPIVDGSASLNFTTDETGSFTNVSSTTNGNGTPVTFNVDRNFDGSINNININQNGFFYQDGDEIYISGADVGGSSPTHDITLTVDGVRLLLNSEVYEVVLDQSNNIASLLIEDRNYLNSTNVYKVGDISTTYTIDDPGTLEYRFFIDTGSGAQITPNISLYSGNTYSFDLSDTSNTGHVFSLSKFRDGIWGPSYIQNVTTTFDVTSAQITVSDTSGILPDMLVTVESGSDGELLNDTKVASVDSATTITLTKVPLTAGSATVTFRGYEYTDGVTRTTNELKIKVSDTTPTLYYYCGTTNNEHQNEGGLDNQESTITIDLNNPKTFGSGFQVRVAELTSNDVITGNILDGIWTAIKLSSTEAEINNLSVTSSLESANIVGQAISLSSITSTGLTVTSPSTSINGNLNISTTLSISSTTGDLETTGEIKTTDKFNSNDFIIIEDNIISSTTGNSLVLKPPASRVVKVDSQGSLIIPSGPSSSRPPVGVVENGAIRFNTDSGQYEGYSASTTSWASLGGVRDLDGNTYIAAEASVGANDNTLYFFNDGNNTVSVTPNYLQFVNVKKIRSINTTAPAYVDYATNTQVTAGDYVKYRNNIYEVTQSGQTGTSGNEPTHTSGAALNGTAELTWSTTAVAPLTFEETEEVRIDPLGFTDLVVNAELRFSNNVISTDLNDLIVRPNTGKKVTIDTNTSLVVPVGDSNQRGVATQGSIRFNTTTFTYEGYDGTNWGSLGGVKDVDQNTYIIPELSPGSNENVLFFYNNGTNTIRLTESSLEFTNIDSITSVNNNLDIEAQTVTFNSLSATIDTSGTSTFIHTTKDNLDLGLAVGLNVDPLLRLDINGDIYVNKAFGTGSFDGLKLINSSFDTFELSDLRIDTQDIQLIKGGTNSGAAVLYDPTVDTGSRVTVSVHNQTTGDKEMIEYHVTDKGSDIFHSDISNLITGVNLVTPVFDFDAGNNVRVTFTLTDLTIGDVVNITVVSNTFKK